MHAVQTDWPSAAAVPGSQAAQVDEPAGATLPGSHATQAMPDGEDVPARHVEHDAAPAVDELPDEHGAQEGDRAALANVPAVHMVQVAASDVDENVPGEQSTQVVSAVVPQALVTRVPAGQIVHAVQLVPLR